MSENWHYVVQAPAREQTRARILLLLHRGRTPDTVAAALEVGVATVFNIKRRYLSEGLTAALRDKPRSGKPASIDGVARAKITALACSEAPDGHARWTLRLLADRAVELGLVEAISHNTVKEVLKKTASSGRPTLTIAIDKFTRMILGFYLSFNGAGYLAVMHCLRHAIPPKTYVRKVYPSVEHSWNAYGIPELVAIDNGPEFHGDGFEDAGLQIGTVISYCPVKKP